MRNFYWAALAAFMLDQISKYLVIHTLELARVRSIDVLPPLLNFRYGENRGMNFGLFGEGSEASRWILIALAVVICIAVTVWITRSKNGRWAQIAAGLLVGGALANVIDRLVYGYVLDFMNNSCCGLNNPFVYNLADVFIFAGAIGLIVFTSDAKTAPKRRRKKGQ